MARKPKWIRILLIPSIIGYANSVLLNWISIRQTVQKPLTDASVHGEISGVYLSVDIFLIVWAFLISMVYFAKSRNIQFFAEFLLAELVLTTFASIFHLLTVIPDPVKDCLVINDIPDTMNWFRFARYCGTGMWSFSIMHFLLLYKLGVQSIRSYFFMVTGFGLCLGCIAFAIFTNYCYTAGALVTTVLTMAIASHRVLARTARRLFTVHVSSGPLEEVYPLNRSI